jgi:hypothetical protein
VSDEGEDPRICSTLRWSDVRLPPSVTEADLDALIFSEMTQRLLKVARIIGRTLESLKARSIYVSPEIIAARIRALADAGRIEAVGNLSMWRHSEARLKGS